MKSVWRRLYWVIQQYFCHNNSWKIVVRNTILFVRTQNGLSVYCCLYDCSYLPILSLYSWNIAEATSKRLFFLDQKSYEKVFSFGLLLLLLPNKLSYLIEFYRFSSLFVFRWKIIRIIVMSLVEKDKKLKKNNEASVKRLDRD